MKILADSRTFQNAGSYSISTEAGFFFPSASISNGALNVIDGVIDSVSPKPLFDKVFLFENACIIPRFVNTHTHLEASNLREPISCGAGLLSEWITGLLAFRQSAAYNPENAIVTGANELYETGTSGIGDVVLPSFFFNENADVLQNVKKIACSLPTGIKTRCFLELIALNDAMAETRLNEAKRFLDAVFQCAEYGKTFMAGLSPHAPYTVSPKLLEGVVELSRAYRVPVTIHLAETEEELQLLQTHSGPFCEMMRRFDVDVNWNQTLLGKRPIDYLAALADCERVVIAHGNYLDDAEIRFLAKRRDNMSVAFCPVPHKFFGRRRYPLRQMFDCGVRVTLGVDGRASWSYISDDVNACSDSATPQNFSIANPLSMLKTVNVLLRDYPEISINEILETATYHGNVALGFTDISAKSCCDTFSPGNAADFLVIRTN
ncbi:MAG: amidohydrolase family protein [Planctomycetaceae bacterium]|jgi:cytosine/adenosine deaminase-related metal-dependent hydrolase|nr:amidohydrolase family protein [Planctomycetaceae bacterium]